MHMHPDKVYLARTLIDRAEAPFATYRALAQRTLAALDLPLPGAGTVVVKLNATVLFPPDKRVIAHSGFVGGRPDARRGRGGAAERLVGDGLGPIPYDTADV